MRIIQTDPSAAFISSREIGPWRRMVGVVETQSTTVDGTPPEVFPPSRIKCTLPFSCLNTSSAVLAFSWPEIFAEVTASGPIARSRASATGWSGIRTPIVPSGDNVSGKECCLGTTRVKGPGQKRWAMRSVFSSNYSTTFTKSE